jgi:hypothetical protein
MGRLTNMTSDYVGRIAVAVWIGRLTEDAAREALGAYAAACQGIERARPDGLREAMLAEYRHRREGQELCS